MALLTFHRFGHPSARPTARLAIWSACLLLAVTTTTGCGEPENRQVEETAEMSFDDIADRVAAEENRDAENEGADE